MAVRHEFWLAVVIATAASAFPAQAQTTDSLPSAIGTSTVRSQGAKVPQRTEQTRRVDLNLDFLATYDSNATRSSEARAQANGLVREDELFSPVAAADISLPFGRSVAYLNGSAAYSIYARNTRLNGERLQLDSGISSTFGRCNLSLDGEFGRQRSDVGDLQVVSGADPLRDRNFETTGSIGATASCGGAVGFQPFGSVNYSRGTNSSILRRGSNYRTLTYGGGVKYVQPSIGEIGIIGSIEDNLFTARDNSVGTVLSGLKSFPTRSIGAYYYRDVTRFFTGKLRVNYTDVATGLGTSFAGVTGEASIRIEPTQRVRFDATAYRTAEPSLSYNIDYYVESGIDLGTTVVLTPRLTAQASYDYRHRRYYSSNPNLLFPLLSDDEHIVSGELDYRLNRRISLLTSITYDSRRANDAFYNFDSLRALVGVRGSF